jgi:hypothetical protein
MRKTYENASRVIVIDSWLQNQKVSDLSIAEIIMRIALSGWTRRLWTYQEGTINKKLSVWFADKMVDIDTAIQNLVLHEDLDWLAMKRCLTGVYGQLRGLVRRRQETRLKLMGLTLCLRYRSTSVQSDEALCLGVILDLDVGSPRYTARCGLL